MELEKKLYEASFEGNVTLLQKLIRDDPLILDRIFPTFFNETPLHVAILRDHAPFVREVLTYNPKLVSEPDWLGHTPLHLASSKGNVEIVRDLLHVGASSVLAVSKDGKLPLHLAIMKVSGRVEVVEELVKACRESTRSRVDGGDMGLHLCVRFDNLDALKVISNENDDVELLNAKNDDGNTCLHLATLYKNFEIVKYLLSRPGIDLNARNNNGLTPLELIENTPRDLKTLEILNFLLQSNAQRSNSPPPVNPPSPLNPLTKINSEERPRQRSKPSWKTFFTFDNTNLEQHRGIILITATILAAASALPIINMQVNGPDLTDDYSIFSLTFVPVAALMVLLLSGFSLKNKLCIFLVRQVMYTSIGFLSENFLGSMISNENRYSRIDWITLVSGLILFGLLLMLSALNLIRLIVWIVTSIIKACVKKRTRRATNNNALSNA